MPPRRVWLAIYALTALLLCVYWCRQVSGTPIVADAIFTALTAVNFAHHGEIAGELSIDLRTGDILSDTGDSPQPTMYREPLPIFFAALAVKAVELSQPVGAPQSYVTGPRARYLKYQNVFWKVLAAAAVAWLLFTMTSSHLMAFAGGVLSGLGQPQVDTLLSEPIAVALFALATALLVAGFKRRRLMLIVLAGLTFGLLTLTRAAFLYVFIGLVAAIALFYLWRRWAAPRSILLSLAALSVAFAAVVLPWMIRNYRLLDAFQVTERSGLALYMRALKDGMTPLEYRGTFYAWAPGKLAKLAGALTGFGPKDLKLGGRLQRLNRAATGAFGAREVAAEHGGRPQDAISFYRQARAQRVQLAVEYQAAGVARPVSLADRELGKRAMQLIREHPGDHAALIVPYLWRSAAFSFPLLLIAFLYSLRRSHPELLLVTLAPFGYVLVLALFVNFEPRYGIVARPLVIVVALYLLALLWQAQRKKLAR